MSNFFNSIGVADMEKVHSAVIGWILSDKFDELNPNEKSEILCSLFGEKPFRYFSEINVIVEVFDIDILITTKEHVSDKEECWVIENKIKSSQHSNQLDKYVEIIRGVAMTSGKSHVPITTDYKHISACNQHYCFLTLIEDDPIGTHRSLWINKRYSELFSILSSYHSSCSGDDGIIYNQYTNCIKEISNWLEDFCNYPGNYPHVFTDGHKKKTEKDYVAISKDPGKYACNIAECGLETIFQKAFLKDYVRKNLPNILKGIDIKDTRGTAMFDYTYNYFGDFLLQIQFQGHSFKVVILHKDYGESYSWKYSSAIYGNMVLPGGGSNNVYNVFDTIKDPVYSNWKLAPADGVKDVIKGRVPPSTIKVKPRIALSNSKIAVDWMVKPNSFTSAFKEAVKLASDIEKRITTIP